MSPLPDNQFIDVENFDDLGFATGADWGTEEMYAGMRDFEDAYALIPRTEWAGLIDKIDQSGDGWLERRIRKIKNQKSEGTCVYNMLALMLEVIGNWQWGDESWIELSPVSGYRWNAPGPGTGSSVPGSLTWAIEKGLLPARTERNLQFVAEGKFKHTHPSVGYYERFQEGWQETALFFRAHEFLRLTSVEAWFTALLKGFPCGGGRNSHAICHVRPMYDNGRYFSLYANSWGEWGSTYPISPLSGNSAGFGADSESLIRTMVSRGAFCICSRVIPPWHLSLAV